MMTSAEMRNADDFEAAMASAREPMPAPLIIDGSTRRYLIDRVESLIEILDRSARQTKVRHERQRFEGGLDAAQQVLDMIKVRPGETGAATGGDR